jgi:arylsulfatase A
MGNWKLVRNNIDKSPQSEPELYDLKADPGESVNLALANPEIVKKMEGIMKQAHIPSKDFPFASEISQK